MAKTILERAEASFRRKKFLETVRLLEPMVVHYRESALFYKLLGLACLQTSDSGGAATYLRRALQLSPADIDIRLALAALSIRRREIASAVEDYLGIIDEHPANRQAKAGLEAIRTLKNDDGISLFIDSPSMKRLYPLPFRSKPCVPILVSGLVALAVLALAYITLASPFSPFKPGRGKRIGMEALALGETERKKPLGDSGKALYILTEKAALSAYDRAMRSFASFKDNLVVKEANRLIWSNASDYLKSKARLLKSYVERPSFANVEDSPVYRDVMADPALYEDCAILWKGLAANIQDTAAGQSFDFLVGYHDKKKLEGLIRAQAPAGFSVAADEPLEILAFVRLADPGPWLEVISVHELIY